MFIRKIDVIKVLDIIKFMLKPKLSISIDCTNNNLLYYEDWCNEILVFFQAFVSFHFNHYKNWFWTLLMPIFATCQNCLDSKHIFWLYYASHTSFRHDKETGLNFWVILKFMCNWYKYICNLCMMSNVSGLIYILQIYIINSYYEISHKNQDI